MHRVLIILLAGAVFIGGAWLLAGLPGHVTAELGDLTIDIATPVALIALIALFCVGYTVLRLMAALWHLPGLTGRWRADRRREAGDIAVTRTLLALAAGAHGDARREAHKSRKLLGDTPQTLLLAAEAGRMAGRDDETEAAFRALADRPDAALLGYRGLFRLAVGREDWTEAAALASQAEKAHPGANWLRPERSRLEVRAGNWANALALAPPGASRAALAAAAGMQEPDPVQAVKLAKQAWKDDPALAPAVVAYAGRLRAMGKEKRAQAILRHAWTVAPQPDVATCALQPVTDKLERAKAAQRLTSANPEHPESRLLLARTALQAGLTGEARHQAEAAQVMGLNQRRLWLLLAEIEESEHGDAEAGRTALRRAADADPDPVWRCDACHAEHPVWLAACRDCATPGSLRWAAGPPPVRLAIPTEYQG
jgi:HemY protein